MSFQEFAEGFNDPTGEEIGSGLRAISLLRQALEEVRNADRKKSGTLDDWKHFKVMIENILSSDNNEAGLEPFVQSLMDRKMKYVPKIQG